MEESRSDGSRDRSSLKEVPVFILAGGLGTRLSEETQLRPKPMVEIGSIPILLHIMRSYYAYGFDDFVICAGYKSFFIKEYFLNYQFKQNHMEIDHRNDTGLQAQAIGESRQQERWRVRVIDTGENSMTGARVGRALNLVDPAKQIQNFALTYGDGLCDVDLNKELKFHLDHGKTGTVLGVNPVARFGELDINGDSVVNFSEKPQSTNGFINGGFFFFKRTFGNYLSEDAELVLEKEPLVKLARDSQLKVFRHQGFWQPMDTLRDRMYLEELWKSSQAPWAKTKNA